MDVTGESAARLCSRFQDRPIVRETPGSMPDEYICGAFEWCRYGGNLMFTVNEFLPSKSMSQRALFEQRPLSGEQRQTVFNSAFDSIHASEKDQRRRSEAFRHKSR